LIRKKREEGGEGGGSGARRQDLESFSLILLEMDGEEVCMLALRA
jgi:hypothetical protein